MLLKILFLYFFIFLICKASNYRKNKLCSVKVIADIESETYSNSEPSGLQSGQVTILNKINVKSVKRCVKKCCHNEECTSITFNKGYCILYRCKSIDACTPSKSTKLEEMSSYIILLETPFIQSNADSTDRQETKSNEESQQCEVGSQGSCPPNAFCKRMNDDKFSAICVCNTGFFPSSTGCIKETSLYETTEWPDNDIPSQRNSYNTSKDTRIHVKTVMNILNGSLHSNSTKIKSTKISKIYVTTSPQMKHQKKVIVANAGPDLYIKITNQKLSSSPEVISIHGSATDKHGVPLSEGITYTWKREPTSLAVGLILNNSDHKATLMLGSLIRGKYTFLLTVTHKKGFNSSDSVNLFVSEKSENDLTNLVDVLFETNVYNFTEKDLINFSKRMAHVIQQNLHYDNCQVHVKYVSGDMENKTMITFYAESINPISKESKILHAGILEKKLKMKLIKHKFIFDFSVAKFQSRICYNSCGGHGLCNFHTHRCECHRLWMTNSWNERSSGFSNCDTNIAVIVVLCIITLIVTVFAVLMLKTFTRKCRRRSRFGKEILRYKLLDDADLE